MPRTPADEIGVTWEDPPQTSPTTRYDEALRGVKENPGRWARLRIASQGAIYSARKLLIGALADDNRWQVVTAKQDDEGKTYGLYVRYRTDEQLAENGE